MLVGSDTSQSYANAVSARTISNADKHCALFTSKSLVAPTAFASRLVFCAEDSCNCVCALLPLVCAGQPRESAKETSSIHAAKWLWKVVLSYNTWSGGVPSEPPELLV